MKRPILYIVIPCYNEEEVLPITSSKIIEKTHNLINKKKISTKSKICFVDDGSKDNTWNIVCELNTNNKLVSGIKLSRNKGHQNALLAGLITNKEYADVIISMDADLQDDIDAIDAMIDNYNNGSEIVYGVRKSRKKDSFFKRNTAQLFYKLMRFMGVDIIYNHADYRLLSKKVLNQLEKFDEVNLFLRGIIPQIGYSSSIVYYERNKRAAGKSKYPLKKMIKFAIEGITSFSIRPLKMITSIGFIMSIFSFIMLVYAISMKIIGNTVSGWTFIIVSIWMVSGIQMLSMGIMGEYIGKIYSETKKRPKYIIEKK